MNPDQCRPCEGTGRLIVSYDQGHVLVGCKTCGGNGKEPKKEVKAR